MAQPGITTVFAGHGNNGLQVGYNTGSIHLAAAERPETPPQPSCFIPFRRDPEFVDRGTLLDQIREQCCAPASRVALVGLGGVGKSQLAIEHCYRTAERSPETWVFWAHASNTARLEQSYREIADYVKLRGRKDPQADVFKLVHDWLYNEKNGPWLLVLDNADDAAVLSSPPSNSQRTQTTDNGNGAVQQHLARYRLPSSRHGSVLVTSRTKHAAIQLVEDSEIILIEPMQDAAAHALLRNKLGDTGDHDDSIAELATVLENMPLALVQAAAYIRKRAPRYSVRQYVEEYQRSDRRKTSLLNQEAGHLRRDKAASNSILITWQISFDYVRSIRQSAADLLSLMSFFDRQGIHAVLLRSRDSTAEERESISKQEEENQHKESSNEEDTNDGSVSVISEDDRFEDDILTLRDYSFITITRNADIFEMHSLVQLATRNWLKNHGEIDKWRAQFISNLCAELPTGEYENWEKCQALFPHARAALAQRPKDKDKESLKAWALLLYKAAWYASRKERVDEAEQMSATSMNVRKEVLGEENAETLNSMAIVGIAKEAGGKYKEAEMMNRQTLTQREKVLGPEHPDTLVSMSNLALVLARQGKNEEAEVMERQTLAWKEKVHGPEHPETLISMGNLAGVLGRQGKYGEAEAMNRQTLAWREKMLGPEHPETLTSMSNLALVLDKQAKYEEAEAMNRQTLARYEKVFGSEHPDTLMSMNNLALVLDNQGKDEAESMNRQTLARYEKVLGPEHPDTLMSMSNLALVLGRQGKDEEAEAMNRQTLAREEKVLGPEHPSTLMSMNNLARVLGSQGKYKEAEAMDRQTLARREKVLGPEHPDTLVSMSNLALMLDNQDKYEEAEAMNRQTLARREKVLGPEHPDTLTSITNLALVLGRQGKYEEAEAIDRQTLAQREKVLGPEHPDTLMSVYCLAHLLAHQRRYDESLTLYERASNAYRTVLGEDHPTTRGCRQDYSEMLAAQEQSRVALSPTILKSGVSVRTGKRSKLSRGLAKIGIRRSRFLIE